MKFCLVINAIPSPSAFSECCPETIGSARTTNQIILPTTTPTSNHILLRIGRSKNKLTYFPSPLAYGCNKRYFSAVIRHIYTRRSTYSWGTGLLLLLLQPITTRLPYSASNTRQVSAWGKSSLPSPPSKDVSIVFRELLPTPLRNRFVRNTAKDET